MISVNEHKIKPLEKEFNGRGEVNGYFFHQISAPYWGFVYEVSFGKGKHYEVFKKRINARYGNVSYPTSKAFGKWAWTTSSLERAKHILETFKD